MQHRIVFGLLVSIFCCLVQAQEKADEQLKQEVRRAVQKALDQDAEARKQSIENKQAPVTQEKAAEKELTAEEQLAKLEKDIDRLASATSPWFWEKWFKKK